jgi:uncharacterized protein
LSEFLDRLPMLLAMGLAGSLHCAGMCGGLAVLAGGARPRGRFLLYLAGKASAYVFLGALAGALGQTVLRTAPIGWGSRALAIVAGALLLLAGLETLGVWRVKAAWLGALPRTVAELAAGGPSGALLMGAANGLLPCPLVYAFAAAAAVFASPVWGAAAMLVPAVTSALPLALCSLLGARLVRFRTVAALLMLAMAALTLYRGVSLAVAVQHHLQ